MIGDRIDGLERAIDLGNECLYRFLNSVEKRVDPTSNAVELVHGLVEARHGFDQLGHALLELTQGASDASEWVAAEHAEDVAQAATKSAAAGSGVLRGSVVSHG